MAWAVGKWGISHFAPSSGQSEALPHIHLFWPCSIFEANQLIYMTLEYPMFATRDLIIPGAVSDMMALAERDIGIACLGTMPRRSADRDVGDIDGVIEMGGTPILPGDRFWWTWRAY
ncbi:hypothetical protein [Sphingobium sp. UBA5915]|jgi:hypothetical protein|uniref:RraA family protein n=2 Tax=Sphingobium TaxID=165695 RepID=UPI000ED9A4FB|nr:hypothetical protein [Sphingobium sp. UBA5915]MEC9017917.1 hypothetical protein [Pseudomonadota bacterium]MEE2740448.1 hypothetical protein [Pseudomonadota bacterium]HCW61257.1 hypothetical protein [Sphingobium sp.]|tara:strand:+ start:299 stop:649 length:351 start_codon:yes stop_codon:yes gene_type:complete